MQALLVCRWHEKPKNSSRKLLQLDLWAQWGFSMQNQHKVFSSISVYPQWAIWEGNQERNPVYNRKTSLGVSWKNNFLLNMNEWNGKGHPRDEKVTCSYIERINIVKISVLFMWESQAEPKWSIDLFSLYKVTVTKTVQ